MRRESSSELLAASEGTLGTILSVTMNLVPAPERTALVLLQFDDLVAAMEATNAILEVEPSAIELMDSMLISLTRDQPAYASQFLPATLLTGATLVSSPHMRPAARLRLLRDRGATMLSGVPTQLERLVGHVEESGEAPPSLRRIVAGSEPLSPELVDRLQAAWGPVVMNAYGTTETGTVAVASPAEVSAHPASVGRQLPGTEIGVEINKQV